MSQSNMKGEDWCVLMNRMMKETIEMEYTRVCRDEYRSVFEAFGEWFDILVSSHFFQSPIH